MELLIARNDDPDSRLPYLLRVPLGDDGLVFRTKGTWPRTSALYCHPVPATDRPGDPDVVERIALKSCVRRGAAIDVVAELEIVVDAHERYAYRFAGEPVRAVVRGLACGDYAITSGPDWPTIPIVFCETRALAAEWTYRYLAAAQVWAEGESAVERIGLAGDEIAHDAAPDAPRPSTAEVRAWARANGLDVPDRGRLRPEVFEAWPAAQQR